MGGATAEAQKDASPRELVSSIMDHRDASTQIMPRGANSGWYKEAIASIESREYALVPTGAENGYGAMNVTQHLGYVFGKDGYSVNNFNADGSTKNVWKVRFVLEGIGRGSRLNKGSMQSVRVQDHSVAYDFTDYSVTYENRRQGMEQSFRICRQPGGAGVLRVVMGLEGDLIPEMGKGEELKLHAAGDRKDVKLMYDQYKVWDSKGRILPAHMKLEGARRLVLTVDDREAVYPLTIDPLNHTPSATMNLTNVFSSGVNEITTPVLGGYSLSGAGDVNGDGAADIIIGAPLFTTINLSGGLGTLVGVARGAAFVYYGVAGGVPSTTPSQVLQPTGLADAALFGFSVSTAGDLDGDGKADIVVGAPGDSVIIPGTFPLPPLTTFVTGRVYVYKGSSLGTDVNTKPTPSATLNLPSGVISSLTINPLFGFSVSTAGDITHDGLSDIVVGCPGYTAGQGRVDIYYGANTASGLSSTTSVKNIIGGLSGQLFGFSVADAGDVNSDTYGDIIVGAPGILVSILQGHAYVFHGSATGISPATAISASGTAGTTLSGTGLTLLGTLYGFSVSGAGDVNNDGHSDVIVGEPLKLDGIAAAGRAYIYNGSASANGVGGSSAIILQSPRSPSILGTGIPLNLLFGYAVGRAGNVVGDAAGDVIVGEPGSTVISNTTLLSAAFASLGLTLNTSTSILNGAVYLYAGTAGTGIVSNQAPYWTLQNSDVLSAADMLGSSVHYAGDVNKDGFDDFLVGTPSGGLDLGVNLSNRATNVSLSIGNGLFGTGNSGSGNSFLYYGFSAALPVKLLSFAGAAVEGGVRLDWATSQEVNSDHFEVERSTDNSNFTKIGTVTAAHNSSVQTNYNLLDGSPAAGTNYYRLKMVDLDGSSAYSKIITVNFSATGISMIGVYPNPVHGSFRLLFKNMPAGRYDMSLVNPIGQVVMARRVQVSNNVNYNEVIDQQLAQGTYMVRVVDEKSKVFVTKLVVE